MLHKRIDHDYEIARLAVAIAMFFNGALVTPETRGNSVLLEIHRLGYLNLRFASDESIAGVEKMNPRKAGFKTSRGETSNSRAKLISTLRNQIKLPPSEALARWYDRGTLQECGSFIQKVLAGGGVRIEAAAGKHDDLLMADGINLFVLLDEPYHFERMAHTQNTFLDDEMLEPGMEEEFSTANSGAVCNSRSARVKAKPRIEQVDIDEFIGRRS